MPTEQLQTVSCPSWPAGRWGDPKCPQLAEMRHSPAKCGPWSWQSFYYYLWWTKQMEEANSHCKLDPAGGQHTCANIHDPGRNKTGHKETSQAACLCLRRTEASLSFLKKTTTINVFGENHVRTIMSRTFLQSHLEHFGGERRTINVFEDETSLVKESVSPHFLSADL